MAVRRQRVMPLHDPPREGDIDQVEEVAKTFDARTLRRRFELTLDDLAALHYAFAREARRLDPLRRWYRLAEVAPRKVTDELNGIALRPRLLRRRLAAAWALPSGDQPLAALGRRDPRSGRAGAAPPFTSPQARGRAPAL
jgi:hypothetical protein